MQRLVDKTAIVTGGATGLGAEIATVYAEEGARVVIGDIRTAEAAATVDRIRAAGGEAIFVRTDVTQADDVEALVRAGEEHYGRLDVMTANAGVLGHMGLPLVDIPDEHFEEVMNINFMGVVRCFKHAIPALERAGGGSLLATASVSAHRGVPRLEPYSCSKAAIVGLVRSLAAELSPRIRVNAVSPGRVRTEIWSHAAEMTGTSQSMPMPMPAPRSDRRQSAEPREIAWAFVYLASDEASFVTGQALRIDGGRSVFDG
jgi:NAD(P)-dependent dehydrogenase (short-subunit alcohol dehydrogenase family)